MKSKKYATHVKKIWKDNENKDNENEDDKKFKKYQKVKDHSHDTFILEELLIVFAI